MKLDGGDSLNAESACKAARLAIYGACDWWSAVVLETTGPCSRPPWTCTARPVRSVVERRTFHARRLRMTLLSTSQDASPGATFGLYRTDAVSPRSNVI